MTTRFNRLCPPIWRAALAAGLVVSSLLAGPVAAAQPREVRIATVAYNTGGKVGYNGSAGIVDQQGWLRAELEKQGVKLVWVPVPVQSVGASVNEAFANHSIDFAGYGDLPSIILNAGGVETRVVVPGGRGNNVYLVVPAGSSARTLNDLKGKRIALHRGRPWEITFARLAASQGLKLSDFRIANLNPGAGAAALAAGDVDAFVTLSDAFQLVDRKVGRIIWSTKNKDQDWKMRAELWGDKTFIERHPDITQLVATAYVKAAQWSSQESNFDEQIAIAVRSGQSESAVRREYTDDAVPWKQRWSPLLSDLVLDHYQNAIAYSRQTGLIRSDLDAKRLFETRFLNAALKELGLQDHWATAASSTPGQAR